MTLLNVVNKGKFWVEDTFAVIVFYVFDLFISKFGEYRQQHCILCTI